MGVLKVTWHPSHLRIPLARVGLGVGLEGQLHLGETGPLLVHRRDYNSDEVLHEVLNEPGRSRPSQPGGSSGPEGTQNTPYARNGGA